MVISTLFTRSLMGEVVRRGFGAKPMLESAGIDPCRVDQIGDRLSRAEAERLVDQALTLTSDPTLGAVAGAWAVDHTAQAIACMISSEGTLRDAFAALRRHDTLFADGIAWSLVEDGERVHWCCDTSDREGALVRFTVDYALAFAANIGRSFLFPDEKLQEVRFRHAGSSHTDRYAAVFCCRVLFEQDHNAIVFPRLVLDRRRVRDRSSPEPLSRELADRLLQEGAQDRSLADTVRVLLRNERNIGSISIHRVARLLRTSVHSLRRKLSVEGTSFSILLDDMRRQLACESLMQPGTTIQDAAAILGFSEVSAFFRAFKRWTGQTPTEFRIHNYRSAMTAQTSNSKSR